MLGGFSFSELFLLIVKPTIKDNTSKRYDRPFNILLCIVKSIVTNATNATSSFPIFSHWRKLQCQVGNHLSDTDLVNNSPGKRKKKGEFYVHYDRAGREMVVLQSVPEKVFLFCQCMAGFFSFFLSTTFSFGLFTTVSTWFLPFFRIPAARIKTEKFLSFFVLNFINLSLCYCCCCCWSFLLILPSTLFLQNSSATIVSVWLEKLVSCVALKVGLAVRYSITYFLARKTQEVFFRCCLIGGGIVVSSSPLPHMVAVGHINNIESVIFFFIWDRLHKQTSKASHCCSSETTMNIM